MRFCELAVIYITFISNIKFSLTASHSFVTTLYDRLTTYNYSYIRPESDLDTATTVRFKFFLVNLQDLDDNNSKFSVTGYFEINWKDNNLTWDPTSYDNTDSIRIPSGYMWKPHLLVGNPYADATVISLQQSTIRVFSDGSAYWYPADSYQMSCDADVSYFPFDSQTCEIWLLPWDHGASEINVTLTQTTVDLSSYNPNPTWDYVSSNVYTQSSSNGVHFTMKFKRRPTFFMINIIFPIILLGVLNVFVFVLPADSGERVGFSITLLLSIAVFMTIIADSLPNTSSPRLSSVVVKLSVDLIISALMMVCTILGLILHHRTDNVPATGFWKCFVRFRQCFLDCRMSKTNAVHAEKNKIPNGIALTDFANKTDENTYGKDEKQDVVTWKDIRVFLDKCLIVLFSSILIIANIGFFMDIVAGIN